MTNTAPVIERFKSIVPIDNPSGHEEKIRAFISETLTGFGIGEDAQTVDAVGNLFVRIPGQLNKPIIMLSAHMDSVPPCEGIEAIEDTQHDRPVIRSAGKTILGADDKSGIAVILELIHELSQAGFKNNRPLELLFSTKEEVGLDGAKGFDMAQTQAAYCYVLDGEGRVGMIFNAGPSQENIQIQITGRATHAGIAPESGVNAITMAGCLLASLPGGRLSDDLTTNLGVVTGGKALNVVAPDCLLKGEARSHDENKLADLLRTYKENARDIARTFGEYGIIDVLTQRRYDRFFVEETHEAIVTVKQHCEKLNILPLCGPMNIGSDAHILNKNGLATVVLGMGFHYSHSLGEFIFCEELALVYQLVYNLVTD